MIKNDNRGKNFNDQQKQFLPFVLSVGKSIVREALFVLAQLSQTMEAKRDETILQVRGWINGQTEIAFPKSYSCMIHIDQLLSPLWERDPYWDPEYIIRNRFGGLNHTPALKRVRG